MLNAAFIFFAPEAEPEKHRSTIRTPEIVLTAIGVSTFEQGAAAAKEMVEAGNTVIELCGGFGIRGIWIVEQAVNEKARVRAVRFDIHPVLDNKGGDEVFI